MGVRRHTLEKTGAIVVTWRPRERGSKCQKPQGHQVAKEDATSEPGDRRPRSKEIMSLDSRVLFPLLIPFPPVLPGVHSEGDTDVWSFCSCFAWHQANSKTVL